MQKSMDGLMQDTAYLNKLRGLMKDDKIVNYSIYLFEFLNKRLNHKHAIQTVVDMGCGTGFNSNLINKIICPKLLISIDYTQHNLDYAIKKGYIKKALLSSIYDLKAKYKRSGYPKPDLIFLGDVIEHLDDISSALQNLKAIMKDDSFLIIHTPNNLYTKLFKSPDDPTHIHELSPHEFLRLTRQEGFSICELYPSGFPFINKLSYKLSQRVAYNKASAFLFRLFPFLGPSMVLICKK